MKLADALAKISKDWHVFFAWIETLIHHHEAGTLPPAPQPGQSAIITGTATGSAPPTADGATGSASENPAAGSNPADPAPLPEGFASAPNANGYVQLTQVEADRAKYANDADPANRYWAKTVPHWYAIDDTLNAFKLSDAQRAKLVADLAQATFLLGRQGAGEWDFNVAANIPDSAAFSTGDLRPDIAGVHLRNLADALAHQRAHVKAINPQGLDTVAPVAGPTHPGGTGGPGHGAEAGK